MTAVFGVMLVAVIVFLLLMNMRGSNLIGTWTYSGNNAVATATPISTGNVTQDKQQQFANIFGDVMNGLECGAFTFPKSMEFRSDGTVIFQSDSTLVGSPSVNYEAIDGSRLRFSAGDKSEVYGYSVNDNRLTISKDGCPDMYYSK
jgi:hypothetical protein